MLISVNERDPRPIYQQIGAQIKEQIRVGALKPKDELPSVRELAQALGINLHTVHQAYRKLSDEGVITLRLGRRASIAPPRREPVSRGRAKELLGPRLSEIISDAYHLGLSPADFRRLVGELLSTREREGEEP